MELVISLDTPLVKWATARPAVFDIWCPSQTETPDVWTFDALGKRLAPFEWTDIAYRGGEPPGFVKGQRISFMGQEVGVYRTGATALMIAMYLFLPKSEHDAEVIPHHVADALLVPGGAEKELVSFADVNWVAVTHHAKARLTGKGEEEDMDMLKTPMQIVYDNVICPDLEKLTAWQSRMDPKICSYGRTPPYNAIRGLPLPCLEPGERYSYMGGSSQCMWYRDRGGKEGIAAEPEWLTQRLHEVFDLRGPRDPGAWEAHKEFGPQPFTKEAEFIVIVEHCLLAPDPVKPRGMHTDTGLLHNWAREAIEDVIRALGSHAATRRYVYDHRWVQGDGDKWTCNEKTDSNDLSFTIGGDCEDSNSTVYYLALQLMGAKPDTLTPLLQCARACLLVAGVPMCVAGTSVCPCENEEKGLLGSHLFGFFVPFKKFAAMVWGADGFEEFQKILPNASRYVYDAAMPMVIETIMFTSPDYLNVTETREDAMRGAWMRSHHTELYCAYAKFAMGHGENLVFPKRFGVECPLALSDSQHKRDGFIVHDSIVRVFTDAITLLFSSEFRKRYQKQTMSIFGAADCMVDPLLERTISFAAMHNDRYGVKCELLHDNNSNVRLWTTKRFDEATYRADKQLMLLERPFVPLRASGWEEETPGEQPSPNEYERFTVYVYKDHDADMPALLQKLGQILKAEGPCVKRPFGWCWAYIYPIKLKRDS